MARQLTDRRFIEAIASDCEAAAKYLRRVLGDMEEEGLSELHLHAGMLERVYMPGVVAFATDALAQVAAEAVAKRSGTPSPAVREMERAEKRKRKVVTPKAGPEPVVAPGKTKKPRR